MTATQKEITDLYFNYDLSLGEIAEQKSVSRQSVSDCLQKCRKQLEKYEEKLGFFKAFEEISSEYTSYRTQVEGFIEIEKTKGNVCVEELEKALERIKKQSEDTVLLD